MKLIALGLQAKKIVLDRRSKAYEASTGSGIWDGYTGEFLGADWIAAAQKLQPSTEEPNPLCEHCGMTFSRHFGGICATNEGRRFSPIMAVSTQLLSQNRQHEHDQFETIKTLRAQLDEALAQRDTLRNCAIPTGDQLAEGFKEWRTATNNKLVAEGYLVMTPSECGMAELAWFASRKTKEQGL